MEEFKTWIITIIVFLSIICGTVIFCMSKEFSATRKVEKLCVGDKFRVEYISNNPYEDKTIIGGTIIDKHGNYIQYVDKKGDTMSTNIRDAYLFPKFVNVIVEK